MPFLRLLVIIWVFFNVQPVLAVEAEDNKSKVVATVRDNKPVWYAIASLDGRQRLFTVGDIFSSDKYPDQCYRIVDIRKDAIILEDVKTKYGLMVRPGEHIPLEGANIIFDRTVKSNVLEYRYRDAVRPSREQMEDFTVKSLNRKKVVLEKSFDKDRALQELLKEERDMFKAAKAANADIEKLRPEFFEKIESEKIGKDIWAIDRKSARPALHNASSVLLSTIKKVEPKYRFGDGPSLKVNTDLGHFIVNRQGFLIEDLTAANFSEKIGIRKGDLIKNINGYPVNSLLGIYSLYKNITSNTSVKLISMDIVRDGRSKVLIYKISAH